MNRSSLIAQFEDSKEDMNLSAIVEEMDAIRAGALSNKNADDGQKDAYFQLAYRLATGIKALEGESAEQVKRITAKLDVSGELMAYDPLQDGYWKKKDKKTAEDLEELLISIMKGNISSTDAKHHVMQAIKFIVVSEKTFEEREKAYNTVLPFHGAILLKDDNALKRMAGMLLGESYSIEQIDPLTARINGNIEHIGGLLPFFMDRGYTAVRIAVPRSEASEFLEMNQQATVKEYLNENPHEQISEMRKMAAALIKITSPVSIPASGLMPKYLRKRMENYVKPGFKSIDSKAAEIARYISSNLITGMAGGALLMAGEGSYIAVSAGAYFTAETIMRLLSGWRNGGRGTLPLKIALWPLEQCLSIGEMNKENDEAYAEIEIKLRDERQTGINASQYFKGVSMLKIPEEIEENLAWSEEKYRQFGRKFLEHVMENSGIPDGSGIETLIDRQHHAVILSHSSSFDWHNKYSGLFCFNEKEYIITIITRREEDQIFQKLAEILSEIPDSAKAFEKIKADFEPRYADFRLVKYREVMEQLEVAN